MSRSPFEIPAFPAQREMIIHPTRLAPVAKPGSNPHGKPGDVFLPCQVCGEKAGKHSYYGGQVSSIFSPFIVNNLFFTTYGKNIVLDSKNSPEKS